MNLVFFTHPSFLGSQSMPRFVEMLSGGMRQRGHTVELWSPKARFFNLPLPLQFKKWLGYIDQYLVFPLEVRWKLNSCDDETLFVFTDQALGPWVPLVSKLAHVIHCHDFLAQRSAMGEIAENPTGWTGKKYQQYIRKGYQKGKNFVSVSKKTQYDLHQFLVATPKVSEVVYNGLNQSFDVGDTFKSRSLFGKSIGIKLDDGYMLHVGGNQWYKNRTGVIEIYNAWRLTSEYSLPLILIGSKPSSTLLKVYNQSPYRADIHFLSGIGDDDVRLAYSGASVFVFPSLDEGFGWPIAEAMASGTVVITTDAAPMTEVAGEAAFLIPRHTMAEGNLTEWAGIGANTVNRILKLTIGERNAYIEAGINNIARFNPETTLDRIESIYKMIVNEKK